MRIATIFKTTLAMALLTTAAYAQELQSDVYSSPSEIPSPLRQSLGQGQYIEQYISQILSIIRQNASDKISLNAQDVLASQEKINIDKMQHQRQRIILYDQDFDGQVTRDEIFSSLKGQASIAAPYIDKQVNEVMKHDLDSDGIITSKEMGTLQEKNSVRNSYNRLDLDDLLALDIDGDGQLTISELEKLARKSFRTVDKNQDGMLTQPELTLIESANREERALPKISEECTLPAPAADEKIVFLSVHQGNAVSTMSVSGQAYVTTAVSVQIDPGAEKLYIISSSFGPVIWQLQGSVERVSRVVLVGPSVLERGVHNDRGAGKISAGVTGVTADKVVFRRASHCGILNAYENSKAKEASILKTIEKLAGRMPAYFYADRSVTGVHIFNERLTTDTAPGIERAQKQAPAGFDEIAWRRHLVFMKGGIKDFKDQTIISDVPAEAYKVLPKWAGLAKLIGDGSIIPVYGENPSKIVVSSPDRSSITLNGVEAIHINNSSISGIELGPSSRDFRIVKNIPYYPAGLDGALSVRFLIAKGITPPGGDPGHSTVMQEETGGILAEPGMPSKNRQDDR